MASTTTTVCDIKGCTCKVNIKRIKIQVIFTSNQTDGANCKPYLSEENFDICEEHLDHILKGNYVWAYGAQGHNEYYFNTKK